MSGWIKIEKDLESDPRVRKIAKSLAERFEILTRDTGASEHFSACNSYALPAVTQVIGGLTRLWILADSHAREDDTIDIGANDLDEQIGIPGFCALLPECWLRIVDENTVELPGFHAHNGVEAKKRALTQKRVARHRDGQKPTSVTTSNASSLPDQTKTRLDQTLNTTAASPPSVPRETSEWFIAFKLAYPSRAGDPGWRRAMKAANARIAEGHTPREFIDGAARYARYCDATEKTDTEFVKQASTFLGPDKPFLLPWAIPAGRAERALESNISAGLKFLATDTP